MRFLNLCKSIFITCLQKNKILSLFSVLISCLAVFCFLGTFASIFNAKTETELRQMTNHYVIPKYEKIKELSDNLKNLPAFLKCRISPQNIYYQKNNEPYTYVISCCVKYPAYLEEQHTGFKTSYNLISGRDYTDSEMENSADIIIVAEKSGFKVGDKISILSGNKAEEITVIGIAEKTVLPYSYYKNHKAISWLMNFVFEKELTTDEITALSELCESYDVYEGRDEIPEGVIVTYIFTIFIGVIVSAFSALQVYGVFLYMFSKIKYNFRIMRITGCKKKEVTAINLAIVAIYTLASLVLVICLYPLFSQLLLAFGISYIPIATEVVIAFLIYAVIVLLSVLPGVKTLSEGLLDEKGELI